MKGASWVFAQRACHNRYAIVITNAPPNVYSTREHSNYSEIEEPILKGFEAERHAIQIDYNKSKKSISLVTSVAVGGNRKQETAHEDTAIKRPKAERAQQTAQEKKAAKQLEVDMEHQAAREKAAKRLKAETEQQIAREKKAAKRLKAKALYAIFPTQHVY
ncbi:hypothetical protein LTR37_021586 [Vermiconidia calcicola]|uniref:Uncharacterized protein n=1 Tax=Vermiconidia calcicola TaxID=1690605 RepID=A0ACC3M8D1_9PEZI|nr:hypothetical protein LTR37_021586 [Vermiconidia calcicola]